MSSVTLLNRRVASAFYGRFHELRPAQEAAIEPLVNGKDVVLCSGTGSGKTEAVVAPILSRFWETAIATDSLTILYIAPTKALVNDLEKRLQPLFSSLGLRVGIRHGDRDDLAASALKPHLLITTPESLDVLMFRKDKALSTLKAVIIDEVHILYNTQRGLHLSILLQRLKQNLSGQLQWAALSATVGSLPDVRDFLFGSGGETIFIQHPAHRSIDAKVLSITNEAEFLELVRKLTDPSFGGPTKKLLLFANSRKECDRLAGILNQDERIRPGVFAHYSSLSPELRIENEKAFANSKTAICVATSTLELGIDIGDIDAVLLWGVPHSVESFLQRIGRGNRRQNKTNVICLITDQSENETDDALRFLTLIDAAKRGELPIRTPFELFGAAVQQFLNIIASENGRFTRVRDLSQTIEHKEYLSREAVDEILSELANKQYLKAHGFKNQFGAGENLYQLQDYRMIYGNFPAGSQTVEVFYKSKPLGTVPALNLLRIRPGNIVNFAGKPWRVAKTSPDGIFLEPSAPSTGGMNFTYPGGALGFDSFLAGRMWRLIHGEDFPADVLSSPLRKMVLEARDQLRALCGADQIPVIRTSEGFRYFTFAGYLVNKAAALISNQTIFQASDVSIVAGSPIDWKTIPTNPEDYKKIFHALFEASSAQSVYQSLLPAEFQMREYLQDWLKDEGVKQSLIRLVNSETVKIPPIDCKLLVG
jgi:ATP-dependent Lhr-like helicase